jgi:hypothetical protein
MGGARPATGRAPRTIDDGMSEERGGYPVHIKLTPRLMAVCATFAFLLIVL